MNIKLIQFLITITLFSCSTSQSFIKTDKEDPRLEMVKGKWYKLPSDDYYIQEYNRIEDDSAYSTIEFLNDEKLLKSSKTKHPNASGEKYYLFKGNYFYMQRSPKQSDFDKYEIIKLTKDDFSYKYKGVKDVNEPFLCGKGEIFSIAEQSATFGNSDNDFSNYINQNLDSLGKYSEGERAAIQFDVNCEGKVCNVIHYQNLYKDSPFSNNILKVIQNMPDWNAGKQRDENVNFRFEKMFILENGTIQVLNVR